MIKTNEHYQTYIKILQEELCPALGCTEPISLAYASAVARKTLEAVPNKVEVKASGSIIKNVKSVIVPNTDNLKGIPAAVAAGIVAGNPEKELEVLADVTREQIAEIHQFLKEKEITVEHVEDGPIFDIQIKLSAGKSSSKVRIVNYHTNIVLIEKDGEVLKEEVFSNDSEDSLTDRTLLNMKDIWDFITTMDVQDVKKILDPQIRFNMEIAEEGLRNNYGANIGKVLLDMNGYDIRTKARAMAAAGSDARMNGCELPVIINSGSGNQGLTVSVPVIVYAKEKGADDEQIYRALALSNLTAIHQKTPIGRLSAYCGAVNAGVGAGAGIAYLCGATYEEVILTIINALAILSGTICDGAKASCAAKIAESVDAGILGYYMAKNGQHFSSGDGIVTTDVEGMIQNVGRIARDGMKTTNEEIINIMIGC